MNTTLLIIQGTLAIVFTASGTIIYLLKDKLKNKLSWLTNFSPQMVAFICISKVVGALGLVLPTFLRINPQITLFAAIGLATIMILAMVYHIRKKEYKDVPATVVFLALLLFVASYYIS